MTIEEIINQAFPRYRRLSLPEQQALINATRYALDNPSIDARAFHTNYYYECKSRGTDDVLEHEELTAEQIQGDTDALAVIAELREGWEGNKEV